MDLGNSELDYYLNSENTLEITAFKKSTLRYFMNFGYLVVVSGTFGYNCVLLVAHIILPWSLSGHCLVSLSIRFYGSMRSSKRSSRLVNLFSSVFHEILFGINGFHPESVHPPLMMLYVISARLLLIVTHSQR